jgi:hypothetical protein
VHQFGRYRGEADMRSCAASTGSGAFGPSRPHRKLTVEPHSLGRDFLI